MKQVSEYKVESLEGTSDVAAKFAECYRSFANSTPLVTVLTGPLGAGKTQFVRNVTESLGIDTRSVVSPTFSLCQTYRSEVTVHHLDVYRLADSDEFLELGPDEWFDDEALTFVEWGERFLDILPRDFVQIEILPLDIERRLIRFQASTDEAVSLIEMMKSTPS